MAAVEEVGHPRPVAVLLEQVLEHDRAFARVVAGLDHVVHADLVGLALLAATVPVHGGVHRRVIGDLEQLPGRQGAGRRAGDHGGVPQELRVVRRLDSFDHVALGHVRDLVREFHRQLRLVLHSRDQPGMDVQLAAAKGERVDAGIADHAHAIGKRPGTRDGDDLLHEARHVLLEERFGPHPVLGIELLRLCLRHAFFVLLRELRTRRRRLADLDGRAELRPRRPAACFGAHADHHHRGGQQKQDGRTHARRYSAVVHRQCLPRKRIRRFGGASQPQTRRPRTTVNRTSRAAATPRAIVPRCRPVTPETAAGALPFRGFASRACAPRLATPRSPDRYSG